jgi:hypothetical protein
MALPGISNANEFYSAHYLESVLTNDIKKVRERWAEEARAQVEADPTADVTTPEAQFKALRKPWQKLREAELGITGDPAERLRLQRELFFRPLLEALGYPFTPRAEPVLIGGEAYQVPLLGEVTNARGEPWLWVVECFNPSDEPADPLELTIATRWGCQIDDPSLGTVLVDGDGHAVETWEELISERVFGQELPPRWVLAVSRDQLLLIDRQKWAASRLLRFELDTLLGENNPDALLAAATLLHREHTCPSEGGTPLLDELDENSHKHAYEVSGDLKYALRRSIELLGNEAGGSIIKRIYSRDEAQLGGGQTILNGILGLRPTSNYLKAIGIGGEQTKSDSTPRGILRSWRRLTNSSNRLKISVQSREPEHAIRRFQHGGLTGACPVTADVSWTKPIKGHNDENYAPHLSTGYQSSD